MAYFKCIKGGFTIPPFSEATDAQIAEVANMYYAGQLSLADIQNVWHVGDTRNMPRSAIAASGTYNGFTWDIGNSCYAGIVTVKIADFDHDTLVTPINGKTKALITLCNVSGPSMIMSRQNTSQNTWGETDLYNWCNGGYYGAIPEDMRSAIKVVEKYSTYNATTQKTNNYVFIPSEVELADRVLFSLNTEGTRYRLFQETSLSSSSYYWTRSRMTSSMNWYINVQNGTSGATQYYYHSNRTAPMWCL